MKATFADAFYFLALLNRNDQAHDRAVQAATQLRGRLVTTEFVLLEVGDAFSEPADRVAFLELVGTLGTDSKVTIKKASSTLFQAGISLFRKRPDKGWSLTDCTSFVVMEREGIAEALTGDRHFEQAGFRALLRETARS